MKPTYKIIAVEGTSPKKYNSPDIGWFYKSGEPAWSARFDQSGKVYVNKKSVLDKAQALRDNGFDCKAVRVYETYEDI